MTFAELLERLDVALPDLSGVQVVAQPHCHQSAVLGWTADKRVLEKTGATVVRVPGCCGLAGNWGVEKGHYDASVAVAETYLLPAVRAHPNAVVLADGMSCKIQLADLADVSALHLSELLERHLPPGGSTQRGTVASPSTWRFSSCGTGRASRRRLTR